MTPEPHDDILVDELAAREAAPVDPQADTGPLAQVQGELATLSEQLRRPEPVDPFSDESDCQAAVERVAGLAHDSSQETFVAQAAPLEPAAEIELGSLGHYKLLSKLGQGGMGAVYKALHTKLDRVVALKVLPAGRLSDQQAVSRFEREMRAVGKLQHPHIVAAHDAGEVDGTHYLVMELVEGIDLAGLVQQRGPLPISAACEMVRQAALGLAHAHKHGLVHRDIKPSNLMLSKSAEPGAPPVVKVLDLGLALLSEGQVEAAGELTSTGQVMGTIDYMAPEQGTDTHRVDIRADIYSLGATLYKLLTGKAPFAGAQYDTAVKKLMALATKEPPPVTTHRPDCPPELAKLVHQMLAKMPEARPATPAALAVALEPFARGADLLTLLEPAAKTDAEMSPGSTVAFTGYTAASAYDETHIVGKSAIPDTPSSLLTHGARRAGGG